MTDSCIGGAGVSSCSDGEGGLEDAPTDGKQYGRQDGDWTEVVGGIAAYNFSDNTSEGAPGQGVIRFNSATPANVTEIYISKTTVNGAANPPLLASMNKGATFYLQETFDNQAFLIGTLDVAPEDLGSWFKITITVTDSGALPTDGNPLRGSRENAPDSGGQYTLTFGTSTTMGDPNTGKFRMNNTSQSLVTQLAISSAASNGVAITDVLTGVGANWTFYFEVVGNDAKFAQYKAVSTGTDNGSWFLFDVVFSSSGSEISSGNIVTMVLTSAPSVAVATSGVLQDIDLLDVVEAASVALAIGKDGIDRLGHTGWIAGGVPSINAGDDTLFDYSELIGWVVDHGDPEDPVTKFITRPASTGHSVPLIASTTSTGLGVDKDLNLIQTADGNHEHDDYRTQVISGSVSHPGLTIILTSDRVGMPAYDGALATTDFLRFVTGNCNFAGGTIFSASGNGMGITKSAGATMAPGIAARINPASPHVLERPEIVDVEFFTILRSSTGGVIANPAVLVTAIDPDNWDDNETKTAVDNNKWTILVIYWIPTGSLANPNGFALVSYGQTEYLSYTTALAAFNDGTVAYEERAQVSATSQRAYLFIKKGVTDLAAAVASGDAYFREAPPFRTGPRGIC